MGYAVGIPTCNRQAVLTECLLAFNKQVIQPDYVVVINNNDNNQPVVIPETKITIEVLNNRYPISGPEQAHQTAFEYFKKAGTKIGVRWDDDLIPKYDCMFHLYNYYQHTPIEGAVGGCYPRPGYPVWNNLQNNPLPLGHKKTHIQFFEWLHKDIKFVNNLYSGLMYSVAGVDAVGGFCTDYSRIGFRGETDLTLRLFESGRKVIIQPHALALHKLAQGGVRTCTGQGQKKLSVSDQILFDQRMVERNIDWNNLL